MKVQVTFEVDHDTRLVIGAIKGGKMVPATRDQVREYASEIFEASLGAGRVKLEKFYADMLKEIEAG